MYIKDRTIFSLWLAALLVAESLNDIFDLFATVYYVT